jgi:hypothetical protein
MEMFYKGCKINTDRPRPVHRPSDLVEKGTVAPAPKTVAPAPKVVTSEPVVEPIAVATEEKVSYNAFDLNKMKKADLELIAQNKGLVDFEEMSKKNLIDAILKA